MRFLLALCLLALPTFAMAQDDGTRLSRFLEDQLSSGDDRQVSIQGFRGALSSQASLDRMTISDADGIWLILEDVVLDWSRSALLTGVLQVEELTAARLEVVRRPLPAEGVDLPDAEAQPFSLPDLPVRVDIGRVAIEEIVLGEAVIGLPATLSIEGAFNLANGAGAANVVLNRLDGPTGEFSLDATYDNATRNLVLSLLLEEAEGGLASELLGLPGRPDIRLSVAGEGPLESFAAQIELATDGQDRLAGQVIANRSADGEQVVVADISGDISPLLVPEYRDFFGDNVVLQAQVRQTPEGATSVEGLRLSSAALSLEGNVTLDANGLPDLVSLVGQITPPSGDTVRLPAGGVNATISGADLAVDFDRAEGDTYSLALELDQLSVDDLTIVDTTLNLRGSVAITAAGLEAATAALEGAVNGIAHTDPAMAEALGTALTLNAEMSWIAGAPLILSDLAVRSGDVAATGGASAQLGEGAINIGLGLAAQVGDLSRFAAISGQPLLSGAVDVALSGPIEPLSGAFDLTLDGTGQDLRFIEAVPAELFAGQTQLSLGIRRDGTGVTLRDLRLENRELRLTADASVSSGDITATTRFALQNVGLFTDVLSGPVTIAADAARTGTEPYDITAALTGPNDIAANVMGQFDAESGDLAMDLSATVRDLDVGYGVPPELLTGRTDLSAAVARTGEVLSLTGLSLTNEAIQLTGDVSYGPGDSSADIDLQLADVGIFTDILSGPVAIAADVARTGTDPFDVTASLTGPNDIAASVAGQFDMESGDLSMDVDATAQGINPGNGIPPQLLAGRTDLSARIARADDVLTVTDLSLTNPEIRLTGNASVGPDQSLVEIEARLANVGLFTEALSGPVSAEATLTRAGSDPWQVAADLGGPGGMRADVGGRFGLPDGSVDLTVSGQAPLALANRFIAPRSIAGTLGFNLAVRGQPGLGAVSGTLTANDARVSVPSLALSINNLRVNGQLSSGRLSLDASGGLSTGGQLSAQGSINLASAGLDSQLSISLRDGRLVDPTLYEARINTADLTISGPLARGPQVSGSVTLGETEIRVPEAGLGGSAGIPDIRHVGESPEERLTRQFAGLLGRSNGGGQGSAAVELDVTISAPSRIFLRGRGIDAEFGGQIRIFGTSANIIPTGQFELIRGRLSILGTRLDFTEGSATLQGNFDPFLRLAATSQSAGYTVTISVVGSASSPEITFSSNPSLPEDEVLAQLLFGRSVSGLSPVQLLQLADAATSLAGGSTNSGFLAGLRDGLGLDDLDLSTDAEGNAAVSAGRYLSENIYSDVTINAAGDADLSLNIDITDSITARGSVGSGGGSSLGIFFEQDY